VKKIMRFALRTGLLALALSSATAQSTNVVQRANFVLRGTTQTSSGARLVRVVNKDILAALNATGAYEFGSKAALLFVSNNDQPPALVVRAVSGNTTTTIDVSTYFGVAEIGDEVRSPDDSTRWQTWNFSLDNANTNGQTSFRLWGFTTIHRGAIHTPGIGTLTGSQRVESTVRGVGRLQDAITVFSGSISGANSTLVKE
jgi:hypothetical protein